MQRWHIYGMYGWCVSISNKQTMQVPVVAHSAYCSLNLKWYLCYSSTTNSLWNNVKNTRSFTYEKRFGSFFNCKKQVYGNKDKNPLCQLSYSLNQNTDPENLNKKKLNFHFLGRERGFMRHLRNWQLFIKLMAESLHSLKKPPLLKSKLRFMVKKI